MKNKLFNSPFEAELRVLLVLENSPMDAISSDMILAIDFVSIYGKEFGISEENLHGDSSYKYSELASKKELVNIAIKELVLQGLIEVVSHDGFKYRISEIGLKYISSFNGVYSEIFSDNAKSAFEKYEDVNEFAILKMIQEKSKESIKQEGKENV